MESSVSPQIGGMAMGAITTTTTTNTEGNQQQNQTTHPAMAVPPLAGRIHDHKHGAVGALRQCQQQRRERGSGGGRVRNGGEIVDNHNARAGR
jgi:hypothetical protein